MPSTPQSFSILPGNIFACRDIYLAAVLVTLKFAVKGVNIEIEGVKQHHVGYFLFDNTSELNVAAEKYWASNLLIDPQLFIKNWRRLKSEVTDLTRSPGIVSEEPQLNKNFPGSRVIHTKEELSTTLPTAP